jgi:hypothetical protein
MAYAATSNRHICVKAAGWSLDLMTYASLLSWGLSSDLKEGGIMGDNVRQCETLPTASSVLGARLPERDASQ